MIPYGRQSINDEDIAAVVRVLKGDWLTSGPDVTAFERELASVCGVRHAVAVANGTAALHVACLAAGVSAGDRGVTSPLTFLASANAIAYCGGRPEFCDVDERTLNLSPEALERSIAERGVPKVVIPVDFTGRPADLPAIWALARRHGFRVIEDAAHALGSRYRSRGEWHSCGSCTHSDLAILSFHPVKTVTTGEGGAVLTNDAGLARLARAFANHGVERDAGAFVAWDLPGHEVGAAAEPWLYQQQLLGHNYRITDLQCALGRSQLRRLETFKARRRDIAARYTAAFSGLPGLSCPGADPDLDPCYHLYLLRLGGGAAARSALYHALSEAGINAQVHYIPVHLQPWYRQNTGTSRGDFPVAESVYASCISLPLYPGLGEDEVGAVIAAVRGWAVGRP